MNITRKMRWMVLAVVIMVAASGMIFASGQGETAERPYAPEVGDDVSLSGTLTFDQYGNALLSADGKTYLLHYPRRLPVDLDINSGDRIGITGFEVQPPEGGRFTTDEYPEIAVDTATINGETYNIRKLMVQNGGPAGGFMGGPMSGRFSNGPRSGRMMYGDTSGRYNSGRQGFQQGCYGYYQDGRYNSSDWGPGMRWSEDRNTGRGNRW
ncbi:MAG: hypothetical protein K9L68_07010 [Spirochaetales bacterium]|nr:hypothetical protein [Spirochaetales bacterium]MCF7938334.1 hypothetical protein [Spirochaetales bacterium]